MSTILPTSAVLPLLSFQLIIFILFGQNNNYVVNGHDSPLNSTHFICSTEIMDCSGFGLGSRLLACADCTDPVDGSCALDPSTCTDPKTPEFCTGPCKPVVAGARYVYELHNRTSGSGNSSSNSTTTQTQSTIPTTQTTEEQAENRRRAEVVRSMTLEAWQIYRRYAWGQIEVMPPQRTHMTGHEHWAGLTILKAMPTLWVMGLRDEFRQGRDWVERHFRLPQNGHRYIAHEVLTYAVSSLLSCHALSGDVMFAQKATEIMESIESVYRTNTGLPLKWVNATSRQADQSVLTTNIDFALGGQLELRQLSAITGNGTYRNYAKRAQRYFASILVDPNDKTRSRIGGNEINVQTGEFPTTEAYLWHQRDWFEDLLHTHLQSNGQDQWALDELVSQLEAWIRTDLFQRSRTGLRFTSRMVNTTSQKVTVTNEMYYSDCYLGAMLGQTARALEARLAKATIISYGSRQAKLAKINQFWVLATEVTETCHQAELRSRTGLAPESIYFDATNDATNPGYGYAHYMLRGESMRSYMVLWRLTRERKYRDQAWALVEAIRKHCHSEGGGYVGINDVNQMPVSQQPWQKEWWFGSTLKYLYLTFVDDQTDQTLGADRTLPLDRWILTRQGHAFPVFNTR